MPNYTPALPLFVSLELVTRLIDTPILIVFPLSRCINRANRQPWDVLSIAKGRIVEFLESSPPAPVGVCLAVLKFAQHVILVQTWGVSDPRVSPSRTNCHDIPSQSDVSRSRASCKTKQTQMFRSSPQITHSLMLLPLKPRERNYSRSLRQFFIVLCMWYQVVFPITFRLSPIQGLRLSFCRHQLLQHTCKGPSTTSPVYYWSHLQMESH